MPQSYTSRFLAKVAAKEDDEDRPSFLNELGRGAFMGAGGGALGGGLAGLGFGNYAARQGLGSPDVKKLTLLPQEEARVRRAVTGAGGLVGAGVGSVIGGATGAGVATLRYLLSRKTAQAAPAPANT